MSPILTEIVPFYTRIRKKTVDAVLEIQYCEAKKHPTLKEPPVQFDIAASGLDENTEAGKDNMDIIKKRIEELRRK